MKLRTKYIIFVGLLHLVTLVLTYFIFDEHKVYFIISEVFIIISVVLSRQLYRQLIQPLKLLMQGVDAIKDKDFNIKLLHTGKHEVDELVGIYNRMMDELRTERTLQEQQHFFLEKLIHTSPTGIVILDYDNRVQQINPKALQLLGMPESELADKFVHELQHPIFTQITELTAGQTAIVRLDGANSFKIQRSNFIDRGFPRSFIMIEDLTAEILVTEKNVYGKVIRMMAHEVNNTIGPVNSILESAMKNDRLWQEQDMAPLKNALQVAADRNQNLNLFMRNFADLVKLPPANKQPVVLQHIINSVMVLMSAKARENNVELVWNQFSIDIQIQADEQQLEQALINIVKNAIEAIDAGGQVVVNLYPAECKLVITDTGHGISAEQSANLFSPFFTTKKDGQGIGLTLVREILLNHQFEFSLKTVAPRQTAFSIYWK